MCSSDLYIASFRLPGADSWIVLALALTISGMPILYQFHFNDAVPALTAWGLVDNFFAGIAGWPLALKLAGWPDDRPVWTGSCPCQPFSAAGKGAGFDDARHLWPVWYNLIRECRPEFVFGEQVASSIGKGWLDWVSTDLEKEGYACGASVLGAHSIGAPHIRQRVYWIANNISKGREGLEPSENIGIPRQWNWRGKEDMQFLAERPFSRTDRWPQPLIRRVDDGLPSRLASLHGYGNAIVPQVAAEFIKASIEAVMEIQ